MSGCCLRCNSVVIGLGKWIINKVLLNKSIAIIWFVQYPFNCSEENSFYCVTDCGGESALILNMTVWSLLICFFFFFFAASRTQINFTVAIDFTASNGEWLQLQSVCLVRRAGINWGEYLTVTCSYLESISQTERRCCHGHCIQSLLSKSKPSLGISSC